LFFKQIKHHGDNFSYIIADEASTEAAVVDPSYNADEIIRTMQRLNLTTKYTINTHQHSDHVAGNQEIKVRSGAKIVAHRLAKTEKDIGVVDGDILKLGSVTLEVLHTPGHSPDSICLLTEKKLLTGDTLFVGECGRTDLPGGSSKDMYHSLFDKLMKLDGDVEVYPGHDYGIASHSTIEAEIKTNYTMEKRTLDEFMEFMKQP